ncbi:hypothetical protein ACHAPA_011559 [Fusarium lateritium]
MPQKGLTPNRGRNTSTSSRFDRFETNDNRWSHQNQENFNGTNPGLARGGYQRGGGRKGRRGGHSTRNATAPVMQPHNGPDFVQKKRDGPPWRDQWRRGGSDLIQVTCENVQNGLKIKDYVHCSCQMCEARNRSVHIIAEAHQDIPQADMLSRIKFGLSERYGFVEEVYPLASKEPGRFIARFADSSSVGEALTMGGGNMPEQGVHVTFSPALRSKWTLSAQAPTRAVAGQSVKHNSSTTQFSPYPFGLSVPANALGISAATAMVPGMIYPPLANPVQTYNVQSWHKTGGQRALSGFVQPPKFEHSSAVRYPMTNSQHPGPGKPILCPAQFPAPTTMELEKNDTLLDEPLQTKPPAEEALDDIHQLSQGASDSPRSDGSKCTGRKARVSLPNTPTKSSHGRHDSSITTANYPAPKGDMTVGEDATTKLDSNLENKFGNRTGANTAPHPQAIPAPGVVSKEATHHRAPSAFTEHEIKERQQAWAKISMPLNPRRPKPFTPTKPNNGNAKDENLKVSNSDKHEASAAESDRSTTPTQNVTFTPDTGSVYEPSPKKPENEAPLQQARSSPSDTRSIVPATKQVICPDKTCQDENEATQAIVESSLTRSPARKDGRSSQTDVPEHDGQALHVSHSASYLEDASGIQRKGRFVKNNRSKKKKAKQTMVSQSNAPDFNIHQQIRPSSSASRIDHMVPQISQLGDSETILSPAPTNRYESQEFGLTSPIKRHHEDPEQRSTSGSFKRSKKDESIHVPASGHSQMQQNSFDESDSQDEDVRGRKGFRVGRGGSLRMGKQRRPRAIMPGSVLAQQHFEAGTPLPSTDFAFQCRSHTVSSPPGGVRGADNGAASRLNPQAQEFVSPSRPADFNKQLAVEPSDTETSGSCTLDGSATHTPKQEKSSKTGRRNTKTPLRDDLVTSAVTDTTPKHRRALSEVVQKDSLKKGKGQASQKEAKKTPSKNSKRGKGKERAVTVSAKPEKIENKREMTQGTPRTPEHQETKGKNPGLINDDWPTLPASRDRAQSKPQTPSIWGAKTKTTGDDGGIGQGSPVTK